jgi:membrane protein implicated in regulation of membrane protease activity
VLTIVALVLALTVLPAPWGWIAVVGAAVVDLAETGLFLRWSKRRRRGSAVGAGTLVGRRAVVVRTLGPRGGQVKLDGEIWEAASTVEVPPGGVVVVTALVGLVLEVEPAK